MKNTFIILSICFFAGLGNLAQAQNFPIIPAEDLSVVNPKEAYAIYKGMLYKGNPDGWKVVEAAGKNLSRMANLPGIGKLVLLNREGQSLLFQDNKITPIKSEAAFLGLAASPKGEIYAIDKAGNIWYGKGEAWEPMTKSGLKLKDIEINARGQLFVSDQENQFYQVSGDKLRKIEGYRIMQMFNMEEKMVCLGMNEKMYLKSMEQKNEKMDINRWARQAFIVVEKKEGVVLDLYIPAACDPIQSFANSIGVKELLVPNQEKIVNISENGQGNSLSTIALITDKGRYFTQEIPTINQTFTVKGRNSSGQPFTASTLQGSTRYPIDIQAFTQTSTGSFIADNSQRVYYYSGGLTPNDLPNFADVYGSNKPKFDFQAVDVAMAEVLSTYFVDGKRVQKFDIYSGQAKPLPLIEGEEPIRVAVGMKAQPWVVSKAGKIFSYDGQKWILRGQGALDITCANTYNLPEILYYLSKDGKIFAWDIERKSWVELVCALPNSSRIANHGRRPVIVTKSGQVFWFANLDLSRF